VSLDDDALARLEAVRKREVEHAQAALERARSEHGRREDAHRAALARSLTHERRLFAARADFVHASTVPALRAAERLVALREAERADGERAVQAACAARDAARERVRRCEQALRDAEQGRRAIAGRLDARRDLVRVHTERRVEDEADDVYRTAAHVRARRAAWKPLR